MDMKIRFEKIGEFSDAIDKDRTAIWRMLKKNDPETWEAYRDFLKEQKAEQERRVNAAKNEVLQLQTQ